MDVCAFTHEQPKTRRCTIHPCTLTTTLTQNTTNHVNSVHVWISFATYPWMRSEASGSWQPLERDESSGKSAGAIANDRGVALQQCSSTCAALKRRDPAPRHVGGVARSLTPELLDEIGDFIEEEHRRVSVRTVAIRFTLSRTCSRKALRLLRLRSLVIRTVPICKTVTSVIVATSLKRCWRGWRLHLARRISRKISSRRRLNLDVICFSDEKIFKVDAAVPLHGFHTFSRERLGRRNNATSPPLAGIHHAKKEGRIVTSIPF